MNSHKFAAEIIFFKSDGCTTYEEHDAVGAAIWLFDSCDFKYDVWEAFEENDKVKELPDGDYFAYIQGTITFDGGYDSEGGYDVDIVVEIDYINIENLHNEDHQPC